MSLANIFHLLRGIAGSHQTCYFHLCFVGKSNIYQIHDKYVHLDTGWAQIQLEPYLYVSNKEYIVSA